MLDYETGAKRSARMPRYDLIPKVVFDRLAERYTGREIDGFPDGGALKYGESNWEKGLPTSDVINHIFNHLTAWTDAFRNYLKIGIESGYTGDVLMDFVRANMREFTFKDDHLAGAMWGIAALMYQESSRMYHDDKFPLTANATDSKQVNEIKSPVFPTQSLGKATDPRMNQKRTR